LDSLNSYCAELEAVWYLLYWIHLLLTIHNVSPPENWSVLIWINISSVLDKVEIADYCKTYQHIVQESDIGTDNLVVRDELGLMFQETHANVESHQEQNSVQTLGVQLNEACDANEKPFLKTTYNNWHIRSSASIPPTAAASLIINTITITNNVNTCLLGACSCKLSMVYIRRHEGWSIDNINKLD
jgi:hypothetical protein